jgi:thiol-disulfide isomerase/thioredoxin
MKRSLLYTCLLLTTQAFPLLAQNAMEYTGKLDAQLTADRPLATFKCQPMKGDDKIKIPASIAQAAQLFTGELQWAGNRTPGHRLLLVQQPGKPSYVFVDVDKNGEFGAAEKFTFSPYESMKESDSEGEVVIYFPMPNSAYKSYPVRLRHRKADARAEKEGYRYLSHSFETYATGSVEIQGRKTRVQFQVNHQDGSLSARNGYSGMDSDGDGKIDTSFVSLESAYARDELVIFRVGERYLSTRQLDGEKRSFVLREHPASDYQRIELRIGAELPNFSFTDFAGRERSLSEFRGKYLLLEFWGSWCGPCVAEVPNFKKAYEKYRSRGFEILGMDQDKEVEPVRKFLADQGINWPNATTESIKDLIDKRFRIVAYPTTLLLDPQGKIISLGRKDQLPLRGDELMDTLEKLMPAQ